MLYYHAGFRGPPPADATMSLVPPAPGNHRAQAARTPAQVALAWLLAIGTIPIPKSATPSRIHENFAALDLRLDADDMAAIAVPDAPGRRTGPDPARFP